MDNPYSPYVDRTGGSTSWGANPTSKRGPQAFPPLPAFKPYASIANAGGMAGMNPTTAAAISRLRTNPAVPSGAGSGSGGAGRGADASGMAIQGIEGIQGIPTTGSLNPDLGVNPTPADAPTDQSISPDSTDQPPADPNAPPPAVGSDVVARLRAVTPQIGGNRAMKRFGPQY